MNTAGFNGIGGLRRRKGVRVGPSFTVSLIGASNGQAEDGTTLSFAISAGVVDAQRWQTSLAGGVWTDIPNATGINETLDVSGGTHTEGALIRVGVTSAGEEVFSMPVQMTYARPFVIQATVDQAYTKDTGVQVFDVVPFFSGEGLTYSISVLAGVEIDPINGVVTLDTDVMAVQTDTALIVATSNSGGDATIELSVSIQEAETFSLTIQDGEPVITADGGDLTVTITEGIFTGTYSTDIDSVPISVGQLSTGAMALVTPVLSGMATVGETLTAAPGLWLYGGSAPGAPTYQWERDGVVISGASGVTYTLGAADEGTNIAVVETFDAVSVTSNSIDVAVSSPSFTPSDIAGLADDFDAAASATITADGDGVVSWANIVDPALNRLDRFNTATAPTTGAVTQNGLNTVSFDGAEYLMKGSGAEFSESGTIIIAFRPNNADNAFDSIYSVFGGAATFQIDSNDTTNGVYYGRVNSSGHGALNPDIVIGNNWVVMAYRFDVATSVASLWANGAKLSEVTNYNTAYSMAPSRIIVGSNRGRTQHLACDIGQIWRFETAITDTDLANMFSYAQERWGIV